MDGPPQEPGENRDRDQKTGRFKTGNRANPGGRPQGRSITSKLRELRDAGDRATIAQALVEQCKKGNVAALALFLERTEGRVQDRRKVTGSITVRVEYAENDHRPAAPAAPGPGVDPAADEPV